MTTAIYVYSEAGSIEELRDQITLCESWCTEEELEWTPTDLFLDLGSDAYSVKGRVGLTDLIEQCEAGKIKTVVISDLNLLPLKADDFKAFAARMASLDISLIIADDDLEMGNLFLKHHKRRNGAS